MELSGLATPKILLMFLCSLTAGIVTKQSHTYDGYGSDLALDNNITTCMSTGSNRGAWWMRSWDSPVSFHTVTLTITPPLSYFEVHSGNYVHPMNDPIKTTSSLCARIDGSETADLVNRTIRCVNAREATALTVQLVGASRNLKICEIEVF